MPISRRTLIQTGLAAGGGLAIGFYLPAGIAAYRREFDPELAVEPDGSVEVNAWLTIDAGGDVTIRSPHSEMGQGAMTSVALMIAEELDVPWETVKVVFADANRHLANGKEYTSMSTGKSLVVRGRHTYIMQAGASARERLRLAAAKAWGVERNEVTARQGMLTAASSSASYGQFAAAAARVRLGEEPALKDPSQWWLLGKGVARLDVRPKVDGSAIYPMDVKLPGMVHAAACSCPVRGGVLKSYDFEAVRQMPGVIAAVELKPNSKKLRSHDLCSGIAIVADTFWHAKSALERMPIAWDMGDGAATGDAAMAAAARQALDGPAKNAKDVRGDATSALSGSGRVVTADYHRPYECHVPMSPPAAVADVKPGRVDLWTFTQNMSDALVLAANQAGIDRSRVYVHGTFQGGAFGNGNGTDITRQAVEISKQIGRPVKLIRTREEDTARPKARPPVWTRFSAALGENGLPTAMTVRAVGDEGRTKYLERGFTDIAYRVPHLRFEHDTVPSNILSGANRAPGYNNNSFMTEVFVDELALAGGWDPLEWRLKMTEGNERWQRVLGKLKETAGLTTALPRGQGMGIAAVEIHETTVAACATVEVSQAGAVRVRRITVVVNSGYVINPKAAEEQVMGCVAWELGHALHGGLKVEGGRIQNVNFATYPPLRLPEMPQVECILTMSQDGWWGGLGEAAVPIVAPAVANAIFFATGKRVRSTPFSSLDLSWA